MSPEELELVDGLRAHGDLFPILNPGEWVDFASLYLVQAASLIERIAKERDEANEKVNRLETAHTQLQRELDRAAKL